MKYEHAIKYYTVYVLLRVHNSLLTTLTIVLRYILRRLIFRNMTQRIDLYVTIVDFH